MSEMTASERMMATAMGREADRVPVFGVFNDWAWAQVYGRNSFADYSRDPEKLANVMIWSCLEMGADSTNALPDVLLTWPAIAEASGLDYDALYWDDFVPTHPHRLYSGDPLKEIAYGDPLIKTKKDALKLKPADPYTHGRMPTILKAIELANKKLDGAYPVGGVCDGPVHIGGCLMGWTQMFMAMQDDPELWKIVEDVIIATCYEFAKAQIKAGAVYLVSHTELPHKVGSEKFLKNSTWVRADHPPELAKRIWKEFGVDTTLHACTAGPFVSGLEAWKCHLDHTHSFFLPEQGGADAMVRSKQELAPAVVMGNLNPLDTMLHGTPSEVEDACVELIQKVGPGGRFVLGPGCTLSLDVPYENMKAMTNSVRKYGRYPIQI